MKKLLFYVSIYLIIAIIAIYYGRESLGNDFVPVFLGCNGAFISWLAVYIKRKMDLGKINKTK
jgi:hypothetical protein